ncbi:hypothetical protein GCM10020000_80390 [Streptomyces olivoverticillatus]
MPSIGDLPRARRSNAGSLGIGASPVPADHLDTRMPGQPGGDGFLLPAGQQIQDGMRFSINQHGPVLPATPGGEVVHSQHPRRAKERVRQRHQHIQQRDPADEDMEHSSEPCAGSAS